MTGIELYSVVAANNNSAPPNGWPEGQTPSSVNDCARQMMAAIRTWYEDAEWIKWGDTTVYASGTSFTIAGSDVTTRYSVGRRVKAVGSSTGTIYGKIVTTAFSTNTTVTVVWDTGSLSNETLTISLGETKSSPGIAASSTRSVDYDNATMHGADVASAGTIVLNDATGNIIDITGTTAITAITLAEGRIRRCRATGAFTLTNGASLICPTSANIVCVAGDQFDVVGYGSGVVRIYNYQRLAGTPTAYSEGTWTAAFATGTSGTITINGSFATGRYIKIGNMVMVSGLFVVASVSSPVGTLSITGLPFVPAAGNQNYAGVAIASSGLTSAAATSIIGFVSPSSNTISLQSYAAGAQANLAATIQASSQFIISGVYSTV